MKVFIPSNGRPQSGVLQKHTIWGLWQPMVRSFGSFPTILDSPRSSTDNPPVFIGELTSPIALGLCILSLWVWIVRKSPTSISSHSCSSEKHGPIAQSFTIHRQFVMVLPEPPPIFPCHFPNGFIQPKMVCWKRSSWSIGGTEAWWRKWKMFSNGT